MEDKIRLNKYLSQIGFCSRRQADKYIEENRIKIDGKLPELGLKISPGVDISFDGKQIDQNQDKRIYMLFNKPKGIVCTTDTNVEKDNIIDYINYPKRIFPIGRLDKMSEGLIMLTNDGDIVNKILRVENKHEKEYLVQVDQSITADFINKMENGVKILDTITQPCKLKKISNNEFKITLQQGLNRQIRRMCEALGYRVRSLQRIRIMHFKLNIPVGKYRLLKDDEISYLKEQLD
ncbi:MAG: pseudouridine synthase [Psychroflexus sp.]|nr:pseudouridine synthase [Psychroflexus sp.]MDR9448794.1 pseudouridine synthase [Psychroflexus sp.]